MSSSVQEASSTTGSTERSTAPGADAPTLTLIDHVHTIEGGHDDHEVEVDPHWWQDPRNAIRAVAAIRTALGKADPAGRAAYDRNAAAYTARLESLDRAVAACIDRIPPAQRKLVTTHDALGYYADRYGLRIIGAVIPSLSTQAQASAGEVSALVDTIRHEHVNAIFAESSVNPKIERAIAAESGATVGTALWADSLGPDGADGDTYLKSIAANTRAIVGGLTAGRVDCSLPS